MICSIVHCRRGCLLLKDPNVSRPHYSGCHAHGPRPVLAGFGYRTVVELCRLDGVAPDLVFLDLLVLP